MPSHSKTARHCRWFETTPSINGGSATIPFPSSDLIPAFQPLWRCSPVPQVPVALILLLCSLADFWQFSPVACWPEHPSLVDDAVALCCGVSSMRLGSFKFACNFAAQVVIFGRCVNLRVCSATHNPPALWPEECMACCVACCECVSDWKAPSKIGLCSPRVYPPLLHLGRFEQAWVALSGVEPLSVLSLSHLGISLAGVSTTLPVLCSFSVTTAQSSRPGRLALAAKR